MRRIASDDEGLFGAAHLRDPVIDIAEALEQENLAPTSRRAKNPVAATTRVSTSTTPNPRDNLTAVARLVSARRETIANPLVLGRSPPSSHSDAAA
ncbi:hypothetical protein [Pseudomonas sp. OHS18]|uniref:hypothetical protein n=1 Tax=Pseudomonas sp. OHS18 TaxID=3399679 RepID=UPI003A840E98